MNTEFRVWSNISNTMYYDGFHIRPDGSVLFHGFKTKQDGSIFYHPAPLSDAANPVLTVLMQYIGLKADGVKIFEQDIIAIKRGGGYAACNLVIFRRGAFCLQRLYQSRIDSDESIFSEGMPANLEAVGSPWSVIGNAFENSYLLKQTI